MFLAMAAAAGGHKQLSLPTIYGRTSSGSIFSGHNSTSISGNTTFGTAHADRECWVLIGTMSSPSGTGNQVSSVTIGGNTASIVYQTSANGATNAQSIAFARYRDNGSLGIGSINVTVNFVNNQIHSGLIPYAATNTTSIDDTYESSAQGTAATGTISYSGGIAWIVDLKQNSTSSSHNSPWVNDYSFDYGTNEYMTVAQLSGYAPGTYTVAKTSSSSVGNVAIASLAMI
jgi:hypothetical protein